jgi:hypothetical protein
LLFDVHSLARAKERTKKTRQGFPPWNPLPPAGLTIAVGAVAFANVLHLRGIVPTPQMGWLLARTFANTRRVADSKNSCLRASSVLAFLSQNASTKSEFATLRANMSGVPISAKPK